MQSAQTGPAAAPCPPAPPATILNTKYPGHILDNLTWPPCISCSACSPLPAPCTVTRLARGVARPRVSSAHWAASSLSSSMCPGPVSTVHMSGHNTSDSSTLFHPELSPSLQTGYLCACIVTPSYTRYTHLLSSRSFLNLMHIGHSRQYASIRGNILQFTYLQFTYHVMGFY